MNNILQFFTYQHLLHLESCWKQKMQQSELNYTNMKVINLILFLLPLIGFSQVDTNLTISFGQKPSQHLEWYDGTAWYNRPNYSIETRKGKHKTKITTTFSTDFQVHVEIYETRDTLYRKPISHITYFTVEGLQYSPDKAVFDKIVTCRNYRFYIINEEGEKEYLYMDLTKNK